MSVKRGVPPSTPPPSTTTATRPSAVVRNPGECGRVNMGVALVPTHKLVTPVTSRQTAGDSGIAWAARPVEASDKRKTSESVACFIKWALNLFENLAEEVQMRLNAATYFLNNSL